MNVDTKNKTITLPGYTLMGRGHVNWLIRALEQNAELLWGKEQSKQRPPATILTLVKKDDE